MDESNTKKTSTKGSRKKANVDLGVVQLEELGYLIEAGGGSPIVIVDEDTAAAPSPAAGVRVYKVSPDVKIPEYGTEAAACFDLRAHFTDRPTLDGYSAINRSVTVNVRRDANSCYVVIRPGERVLIPTGLIFDFPAGTMMKIYPRSGLSWKSGLTLSNCTAIIDEDYTNEVFVSVINVSDVNLTIFNGDRIAQGEICMASPRWKFIETEAKIQTKGNRTGGFSSTGVQ